MLYLRKGVRRVIVLVIAVLIGGLLGAGTHDGSGPGHAYDDSCYVTLELSAVSTDDFCRDGLPLRREFHRAVAALGTVLPHAPSARHRVRAPPSPLV